MLGGPHGMMEFVRRAPWTLHEAFDGGKWHPSSRIKSIISGDPIDINIKNGPIITNRVTQPIFWGSNLPVQILGPVNLVADDEYRELDERADLKVVRAEAARLGFEKPHQFILKHEKGRAVELGTS